MSTGKDPVSRRGDSSSTLDISLNESDAKLLQRLLEEASSCKDPKRIMDLKVSIAALYKDLIIQLGNKRLTKVESLISNVDRVSKYVERNFNKFKNAAQNGAPAINKKFSTEVVESPLKRRRSSSSSTLPAASARDMAPTLNTSPAPPLPPLPATTGSEILDKSLTKLSRNHIDALSTIHHKYTYQKELIEKNTLAARDFQWLQFYKDRQNCKETRLTKLQDELKQLEEEYKNADPTRNLRYNERLHNRIKRPEQVNRRLHRKLVKAYRGKLDSIQAITSRYPVFTKNVIANLTPCKGLESDEIETDLALMKFWQTDEDQPYREAKRQKIIRARESVETQTKASNERLKELVRKLEQNAESGESDFIKEQKETFERTETFQSQQQQQQQQPQQQPQQATRQQQRDSIPSVDIPHPPVPILPSQARKQSPEGEPIPEMQELHAPLEVQRPVAQTKPQPPLEQQIPVRAQSPQLQQAQQAQQMPPGPLPMPQMPPHLPPNPYEQPRFAFSPFPPPPPPPPGFIQHQIPVSENVEMINGTDRIQYAVPYDHPFMPGPPPRFPPPMFYPYPPGIPVFPQDPRVRDVAVPPGLAKSPADRYIAPSPSESGLKPEVHHQT